jgi:hypothetical protein
VISCFRDFCEHRLSGRRLRHLSGYRAFPVFSAVADQQLGQSLAGRRLAEVDAPHTMPAADTLQSSPERLLERVAVAFDQQQVAALRQLRSLDHS